ncbi:SAM-dependent methyltransferase [Luedemannella flava]|uniref:SAM-dependent methyltransferase n=1 Tax=Luedemannella flava TaxID=349316 RepID=UPI003619F063
MPQGQLRRRPRDGAGHRGRDPQHPVHGVGQPRLRAPRGRVPHPRAGIRQFIDIGTGIPASPNVHEAAHG